MKCALCEKFYQKYPLQTQDVALGKGKVHKLNSCTMAAIKCAFPKGMFSPNNWNCETMNKLRDLVGDWDTESKLGVQCYNNDQKIGLYPLNDTGDFLILTWYKRRGRTEGAWINSGSSMKRLSLKEAEKIIKET